MKQWPKTTSATDIRIFISLAGYYTSFVKGFSSIVAPFTRLTLKMVKLQQSDDWEKIFAELKTILTAPLVLTLLEGSNGYMI